VPVCGQGVPVVVERLQQSVVHPWWTGQLARPWPLPWLRPANLERVTGAVVAGELLGMLKKRRRVMGSPVGPRPTWRPTFLGGTGSGHDVWLP